MPAENRRERIPGQGPPLRGEREVVRRTLVHARESNRGPDPEAHCLG
jgi:hypothetical protein